MIVEAALQCPCGAEMHDHPLEVRVRVCLGCRGLFVLHNQRGLVRIGTMPKGRPGMVSVLTPELTTPTA